MSSNYIGMWIEHFPKLEVCTRDAYVVQNSLNVFPHPRDVLNAFRYVEPGKVRVVILGQDPYHTRGKANGLAFGYHKNYEGRIDSSLENILNELGNTNPEEFDISLEAWARQGVLLLNTCLTVEESTPMSHRNKYGWEEVVLDIVRYLHEMHGDDIVFVGWGAEARKFLHQIEELQGAPNVLLTSHPCKFSHRAGSKPFTGSKIFDEINLYLTGRMIGNIDWTGSPKNWRNND